MRLGFLASRFSIWWWLAAVQGAHDADASEHRRAALLGHQNQRLHCGAGGPLSNRSSGRAIAIFSRSLSHSARTQRARTAPALPAPCRGRSLERLLSFRRSPVQGPHDADPGEHRRSTFLCHQDQRFHHGLPLRASCTALGCLAMYSPASRKVTRSRPPTFIGSSKGRPSLDRSFYLLHNPGASKGHARPNYHVSQGALLV